MTRLLATAFLAESSLAKGLLGRGPALDALLTHHSGDDDALLASARTAAARDIDRDALVASLEAGLRDLDAPEAAFQALARLRIPGTVVVVAGQQPGLLGGPLMVLVKALAAAALARRLDEAGVAAVPLFWHASEDHDHGEADHVGWSGGGALERLRLPLPEDGCTLAALQIPEEPADTLVARVLADLSQSSADAELGLATGLVTLRELLPRRPAESFGTWTGRLLARILGEQGIVVVEPHRLRSAAAAVARYELDHPGVLHAGVERAQAVVQSAGYDAPLALRSPHLVFQVDPETGARRRIRIADGRVHVSGVDGEGVSIAEWLRRLDEDPSFFSWNVAARVLAQDVALPVAAQICGPAELGYVALMRAGHAALGVPQPLAVLRPGVTLVERGARRACTRLGVSVEDVVRHGAAAIPDAPFEGEAALGRLREALGQLPEGRASASKRRRAGLARQAQLFEEALRRESAEADQVRARRRETALTALRPLGRPMERVVSYLPWFARGGSAFVTALLEHLGDGGPAHHILSVEEDL